MRFSRLLLPVVRHVQCRGVSFIDIAREKGCEALIGEFSASKRFDKVLVGMRVDEIADGKATASLVVQEGTANAFG